MNILISICARGGSKGIPGKNIRILAGKPLINYTIEVAQKIKEKYNAKISLSTDSEAIRQVARDAEIITDYLRPDHLATDAAGKVDTIKDLIRYEESLPNAERFDYILDMDVTSPLRTLDDIDKGFKLINDNNEAITLFSVNNSSRNPYFNMVEGNEEGFYSLVKKPKNGAILSRQSAPAVYDMNASFYWYKRRFFDLELKSPITERSLIHVMDHICFDLDNPIDFEFLEFLILNNKIDFL